MLENKTGAGIDTGNGVVTLDVSELLTQLGESLGIPSAALDKIPPDAATITLLKSDQLNYAQQGVRAVKVLSVWLLVLVLGMYGLALYLARGIRRKTLAHIGWALVIVGLLVLVARKVLGNYVINAITQPENRPPAHQVWLFVTQIMGQIAWATIFYGIVLVLGAMVAGPTRPATAIRRWAAPVLNVRPEITWGATAFVWLLLILWGGTHALRTWWGILLVGVLLAAGVVALRQQTLKEFPAPGLEEDLESMRVRMAASVSGAAHKVSGAVHRHEEAEAERGGKSTADELSKLAQLRDNGCDQRGRVRTGQEDRPLDVTEGHEQPKRGVKQRRSRRGIAGMQSPSAASTGWSTSRRIRVRARRSGLRGATRRRRGACT